MPTRIDWCDETVNPLGHWCFGPNGTEANPQPCEYCYARTLEARGMRGCEKCRKFEKHTNFEQLNKLKKSRKPRTIFMQSMGDLFHDEVPDHWIQEVFEACDAAPQHRYLFLTKNPQRYMELGKASKLPIDSNFWYGSTAPTPDTEFFFHEQVNTFVSIEPILKPFSHLTDDGIPPVSRCNWIIVGAETGNRKDKTIPEKWWLAELVEFAEYTKTPIFMKESLRELMGSDFKQQYPWEV